MLASTAYPGPGAQEHPLISHQPRTILSLGRMHPVITISATPFQATRKRKTIRKTDAPSQRTPGRQILEPTSKISPLRYPLITAVSFVAVSNSVQKSPQLRPPRARLSKDVASSLQHTKATLSMVSNSSKRASLRPDRSGFRRLANDLQAGRTMLTFPPRL